MANKRSKYPLKEWDNIISKMSSKELQRTLADPCYFQEYKKLAKEKLTELGIKMTESNTLEVFLRALKKKRWNFEVINDENRVVFTKKKQTFFADWDNDEDFVIIYFIHNIHFNMDDETKSSLLRKAINATNRLCGVTTYYDKNEGDDNVFVMSRESIHFVKENTYFEMELEIVLEGCLLAQYVLKGFLKKKQ